MKTTTEPQRGCSKMHWLTENGETRLFEVFSSLQRSDRVIQDDTQLEKLFTWMENVTNNKSVADMFLSRPEVESFFQHAASSKLQDPFQALVLGLRLGPQIFTSTTMAVTSSLPFWEIPDKVIASLPSWVDGMFRSAVESVAWEEGSVRNAWIMGLSLMCHVAVGLHWALTTGSLMKAVDLLFDNSMFVSNQTQALLVKVCPILLQSALTAPSSNPVCQLAQNVCDKIGDLVKTTISSASIDVTKVAATLSLVRGICAVATPEVRRTLSFANDVNVLSQNPAVWNNRSLAHQLVTTLVDISSISDESTCQQGKLEALAVSLLRQQHIAPAMALTSQLLVRGDCEDPDRLREVTLLPLTMLLDKVPSKLADEMEHVRMTLDKKQSFSRALVTSVNLLSTLPYGEQVVVAEMVGRALSLAVGDATRTGAASHGGDGDALRARHRAVRGDTRTQLALLDFWIKHINCVGGNPAESVMARRTFQDCLVLIKKPGIPVTVAMKGYECLTCILHMLEESEDTWLFHGEDQHLKEAPQAQECPLEELAELLLQGVCDVRWEVRDTAVSTIGRVAQRAKPTGRVVHWLETHKMAVQLWHSVSDGESYVRAAALTALSELPRHAALWQQLTTFCSVDEILSRLTGILADDTEAFPRRSTVLLLCKWLQTEALSPHRDDVLTVVNSAIYDLDWEVKLAVLAFCGEEVQKALTSLVPPAQPDVVTGPVAGTKHGLPQEPGDDLRNVLTGLDKEGHLRCLIVGARDYDQSVQCKSCEILVTVKNACAKCGLLVGHGAEVETPAKKSRLEEKQIESANVGNEKIHRLKSSHTETGIMTVDRFLEDLEGLNIEQLILNASQSIDDYVRNPESLFEDILTSLVKDDEENAIDCY